MSKSIEVRVRVEVKPGTPSPSSNENPRFDPDPRSNQGWNPIRSKPASFFVNSIINIQPIKLLFKNENY